MTARRWLSLAPDRTHARPVSALVTALVDDDTDPAVASAFAQALRDIEAAMRRAFPHNIFGDLDFLAASLWRGATRVPNTVASLRQQGARVAALQELFGHATAIRFRYVHDFVYGFDWAKWVAREPATRAAHGPFSPEFLTTMLARGHELLALIGRGRDRKYPPLPDGRPRNPFGFSREPTAEIALHRHLARAELLPVPAWRLDASPRWDRPYQQLRVQHAVRLGLGERVDPAVDPVDPVDAADALAPAAPHGAEW